MSATILAVYGIMPTPGEEHPLKYVVITAKNLIEIVYAQDRVSEDGQESYNEDAAYKLSVGQEKGIADDPIELQDLWLYNKTVMTQHAEEHETLEQARARAAELIEEDVPYVEEPLGAGQ